MPRALDLLATGHTLISEQFGDTTIEIESLGTAEHTLWNDLGRTEELDLNGRRVSFNVTVEFPKNIFPSVSDADYHSLAGRIVTHLQTGRKFRIVGEIMVDELTVSFPLQSRNR